MTPSTILTATCNECGHTRDLTHEEAMGFVTPCGKCVFGKLLVIACRPSDKP